MADIALLADQLTLVVPTDIKQIDHVSVDRCTKAAIAIGDIARTGIATTFTNDSAYLCNVVCSVAINVIM
jgi:hypothetical protein